nr:zincin-like metallopeptidase domain-containing protein [Tardibacter chloracetimidivorans]
MPNRRAAEGQKTNLDQRPRGIIRVAALCTLCRYRHNGHWTGHPNRLDRDLAHPFGSEGYAREELRALSGQSAPSATLQ